GQPERAVELLRPGIERLQEIGETGFASTSRSMLAEALYELGDDAEAEESTSLARQLGAPDDYETQYAWRSVLARVMARRGQHDEAVRLAREAVELLEPTDALLARGRA